MEELLVTAHMLWADKVFADKVAGEAVQIINQTYKRKFAFYNRKRPRCLLGGLLFLLGYRYDAVKTQNELADCLGTTAVSIRLSYRRWLETFPDLFIDVIRKVCHTQRPWILCLDRSEEEYV
jgi:hypothetical protein